MQRATVLAGSQGPAGDGGGLWQAGYPSHPGLALPPVRLLPGCVAVRELGYRRDDLGIQVGILGELAGALLLEALHEGLVFLRPPGPRVQAARLQELDVADSGHPLS